MGNRVKVRDGQGVVSYLNIERAKMWTAPNYAPDWDMPECRQRVRSVQHLYRTEDQRWWLVTAVVRYARAADLNGPSVAHPCELLSDERAVEWLLDNDHDPPEDVAHLIEEFLIKPPAGGQAAAPKEAPGVCGPPTSSRELVNDAQEQSPRPRLAVRIHPPAIIWDGCPIETKPDTATLLKGLLDNLDDWIKGTAYCDRPSRAKSYLPSAILQAIESAPGKGQRLTRKALAELPAPPTT